jgi:C-terminal processing protease CtpA/Prc
VEGRLAVLRVDTARAAVGIAPGDELLALDGRQVADVAAEARPYWSISWPDAPVPLFFLNGPRNSTLRLRVRSASGVHEVSLPRSRRFAFRDPAPLFPHPAYAILPGNIGFIDLGQVTSPGALDSAMSALSNTRGMLLDDRSAAAYNAQHIVYRFIRDPMPCMRRVESISYLGYPVFPTQALGGTQCWSVPLVSKSSPAYTKPLVVMIGRADVSYGESLAQKLRIAGRATLVGEPTNGTYGWKDGITLPGGATVHFTRGRALWPSGEKYHGVGVLPDVPAHATFLGVRQGRDEVYETAVATLRRLLNE